ncbi:MAG: metallophosphoesterase [bacterium]
MKSVKILTVLFLLLILSIFSGDVHSENYGFKTFKIAFMPDIHLSFDKKDDWILYNESLIIFQDTVKILNKTPDINFAVFGGDLTDNKNKTLDDLPIFLDIAAELKYPYYVIFGDRDADLSNDYSKQDFIAEFRRNGFKNNDKTYWIDEPIENVLLIGLDTAIENRFSGLISQEQLSWLEDIIKNNQNKFIIILMHHSPLPSCSQDTEHPWKNFTLSNSEDFLNIIKKYPQPKLILSGHYHINFTKKINNNLFISTPSIVSYPNEFKILTIKTLSDKIEINVENKQINFKQIVKKAKKTILNTDYAKQYESSKKLLKFQEGDKFSRMKKYYLD